MARKQVIVQLDDQMVRELDDAAKSEGVSRSEMIRRAAVAWLEARMVAKQEREYVESYKRLPPEPVMLETLGRIARETAPDW